MAGHRRVAKKSPTKGGGGSGGGSPSHGRAQAAESQEVCAAVVAAVQSLYDDALKPLGRILRKRLGERSQGLDLSIERLHAVCKSCSELLVESAEGGDWTALLVDRPQCFVDVCSPVDVYPESLWEEAAEYFESLEGDAATLPGGRYSCAEELSSRGVPFLKPYSLGQICHIVQLSISQKKLLGYCSGAVVPYNRSQSMVKDQCAVLQQPCTSPTSGSAMPLADWRTARRCLQEILDNSTCPAPGVVPLSNVKRLFRSMYHIELSETILGHSKVSELLQDTRFADICTVQLQGHGYIVVRNPPLSPASRSPTGSPKRNQNRNDWNWNEKKDGGLGNSNNASSTVQPGRTPSDQPMKVEAPWPNSLEGVPHSPLFQPRASSGIRGGDFSWSPSRRGPGRVPRNLPGQKLNDEEGHAPPLVDTTIVDNQPLSPTPSTSATSSPKKNQIRTNWNWNEKKAGGLASGDAAPAIPREMPMHEDGCVSDNASTSASFEGNPSFEGNVSPSLRSSLQLGSSPADQPMKVDAPWSRNSMEGVPHSPLFPPRQSSAVRGGEWSWSPSRRGPGRVPPGLGASQKPADEELCIQDDNIGGGNDASPVQLANTPLDQPMKVEAPWSRNSLDGPHSPLFQPRASSGIRGGEWSWSPSRRGPGRVPPGLSTNTNIEENSSFEGNMSSLQLGSIPQEQSIKADAPWSRNSLEGAPHSPLLPPRVSSGMRGDEYSGAPARRAPGRAPPNLSIIASFEENSSFEGNMSSLQLDGAPSDQPMKADAAWSRNSVEGAPHSPLLQQRVSSSTRGGEYSWSPSRRGPGRVPPNLSASQKLTDEELHAALLNPACTLRLSELV